MADDDHRRGAASNNFCAVAHDKSTPCKQDYVANCKSQAKGWDTYDQQKKIRNKKGKITKLETGERSFEAHHIAPVACVSEVVIKWDEKNNKNPSVITGTKWCINAKVNMIALPVWAHTIKYYCDNFDDLDKEIKDEISSANQESIGMEDLAKLSAKARLAITDAVIAKVKAPPFANRPQHNYGHTGQDAESGYNEEIIEKLEQITANVDQAKAEHETAKIESLQKALDKLSETMEGELKDRAKRSCNGTHKAWKQGMKKPDSDWYKSFSMAQVPTAMIFPLGKTTGPMADKLVTAARARF